MELMGQMYACDVVVVHVNVVSSGGRKLHSGKRNECRGLAPLDSSFRLYAVLGISFSTCRCILFAVVFFGENHFDTIGNCRTATIIQANARSLTGSNAATSASVFRLSSWDCAIEIER
jgi:hypothetical protein